MVKNEDLAHQSDHPIPNSRKWVKRLTIILTSVLLLAMVGTGGYWLGTKQQQSSPTDLLTRLESNRFSTAAPIQQRSASPTITTTTRQTDPTAGWKVYTNSKFGYTLKYPSLWFDKGSNDTNSAEWQDFSSVDVEAPVAGLGSGIWLRVSTLRMVNQEGFWNTGADERYFQYLHNQHVGESRSSDPRYLFTKMRDLVVDGYPAVQQMKETTPVAQTEYTYGSEVYLLRSKQLFKIEGLTTDKSAWHTHEGTFNTILQTFHFKFK